MVCKNIFAKQQTGIRCKVLQRVEHLAIGNRETANVKRERPYARLIIIFLPAKTGNSYKSVSGRVPP
jgi:hypothetical protein